MEKKTITEMIAHWSQMFNLPIKSNSGFPEEKRTNLALKLIREEFNETEIGFITKNFKETQDGLGDLLWVTIRAMMELGIDPHETIAAIYESNMSKADLTLEDALITYKKYKEQGIDTYSREKNGLFITYRITDNKVLKSYKFQEPKL